MTAKKIDHEITRLETKAGLPNRPTRSPLAGLVAELERDGIARALVVLRRDLASQRA
jgi:hypothetical protein